MALATVCPHCKTTFRVASDQLKLRGGIVRCGTCREIFDGNATLVDLDAPPVKPHPPEAPTGPEDALAPETIFAFDAEPEPEPEPQPAPLAPAMPAPAPTPEPAPAPLAAIEAPALAAAAPELVSPSATFDQEIAAIEAAAPIKLPAGYVLDFDLSEPAPAQVPAWQGEPEPYQAPGYAAEPMPGLELSVADESEPVADEPEDWPCPDELEKATPEADPDPFLGALPLVRPSADDAEFGPVHDLAEPAPVPKKRRKTPEAAPAPEVDEPDFVRLHREKEQATRRRRWIMGAGSVLLAVLLLGQGIGSFRNVLAATYPALAPALAAGCTLLKCQVDLPAQIDTLVLDTGELQSLSATRFQLTTLLRNEGTLTQAWPYLELELTDGADKAVVRRVFTPAQYLPASVAPARGFAGRSEQAVKIVFDLKQVKASGFHIAVFYP
jgi:predicted Zn finger-like uncharacterized protein